MRGAAPPEAPPGAESAWGQGYGGQDPSTPGGRAWAGNQNNAFSDDPYAPRGRPQADSGNAYYSDDSDPYASRGGPQGGMGSPPSAINSDPYSDNRDPFASFASTGRAWGGSRNPYSDDRDPYASGGQPRANLANSYYSDASDPMRQGRGDQSAARGQAQGRDNPYYSDDSDPYASRDRAQQGPNAFPGRAQQNPFAPPDRGEQGESRDDPYSTFDPYSPWMKASGAASPTPAPATKPGSSAPTADRLTALERSLLGDRAPPQGQAPFQRLAWLESQLGGTGGTVLERVDALELASQAQAQRISALERCLLGDGASPQGMPPLQRVAWLEGQLGGTSGSMPERLQALEQAAQAQGLL